MKKILNVKAYGAIGDGVADDSDAIQSALDEPGDICVKIPSGNYLVTKTLLVKSDTEISADKNARLIHSNASKKHRGDFLLSNKDTVDGNENIAITGGIFDGKFDGKNNDKCGDLFNPNACSGAVLNFMNVAGLKLCDITVANSVVYFIRMCRISDFVIEKIRFSAEKLSYNQDGLHFGGGCKNGTVKDIKAVTFGETNDDMIALNADDSLTRLENLDLVCDDIENISFYDIAAQSCHTAVRMLCTSHSIRNITIENITCGCRMYAINMDGARYCRTPLFDEANYPNGCGNIENVTIKNMSVYSTDDSLTQPLIVAETRCNNFSVVDFRRNIEKEQSKNRPVFVAKNLTDTNIRIKNGKADKLYTLPDKSDVLTIFDPITDIYIN